MFRFWDITLTSLAIAGTLSPTTPRTDRVLEVPSLQVSRRMLINHFGTTGITADDFLFRHAAMTKARKDAGQYTNL
jgi:hypothetical protein